MLQLQKLGLIDVDPKRQYQTADWPKVKARVADIIRGKTQAQWCEELEGSDACFAPVLSLADAPSHPHNAERHLFVDLEEVDGKTHRQPAPAPRFSRTPALRPVQGTRIGQDTDSVLESVGYAASDIAALREAKACA